MRRHVTWIAILTALVTGAAGLAGFPGLEDWVRAVLVGLAAVLAALVVVLHTTRGQPAPESRDLSAHDHGGQVTPVPQRLPKPELFQLPPDIANFTDQKHAVRLATAATTQERPANSGAALCVISGKGGVGKSTVAVHVAHTVKASYPSGHLYADPWN